MVVPRSAIIFSRMGRRHRPHLPGACFHVTTRIQNREALLSPPLKTRLVALLREQVAYSDVELFAYVVMPNHLHLVLRQGDAPLGRFLQPYLRRAALLVQRAHRRDGHVFERRYRDRACLDPDYLRAAIVYTHLNPVRAALCDDSALYEWSSFGAWTGQENAADGKSDPTTITRPSRLFALGAERSPAQLAQDYLVFHRWQEERDRLLARAEAGGSVMLPPGPDTTHGDINWNRYLAPRHVDGSPFFVDSVLDAAHPARVRPDLTAIARAVVVATQPPLDLSMVRSRWGGPMYVHARRTIIREAASAGYGNVEIARFLRISPSTVAAVLTAERKRLLEPTT